MPTLHEEMEEDGSRKKRITIVDQGSGRHGKSSGRPPTDPGGVDIRRSRSKLSLTQRTEKKQESESMSGDSESSSSPSSTEDSEAALILPSLQSGVKIKRSADDDTLSETSLVDGAQPSPSLKPQTDEARNMAKSLPSIPRVTLATCPTNTDLAQITDMDPAKNTSEHSPDHQSVLVRSLTTRTKSGVSVGEEEKELKAPEDTEERRKIASFIDVHSGLVGKLDSEGNELSTAPESIHKAENKVSQTGRAFKVQPSIVMRIETENASVTDKKSTVSTQASTARPARSVHKMTVAAPTTSTARPAGSVHKTSVAAPTTSTARPVGSVHQPTVAAPMTEHGQQTAFIQMKQTHSGILSQKSMDPSPAKKTKPTPDKSSSLMKGETQALFMKQMKRLKAREGSKTMVGKGRSSQRMSTLLMNSELSPSEIAREERRSSSEDFQRPSLTPSSLEGNSYLLRYSDREYDPVKKEFTPIKREVSRPSTAEQIYERLKTDYRRDSVSQPSTRESDRRGSLLLRNRETSNVEPSRRVSSYSQPPLSRERRRSDDRSSRPSTSESDHIESLLLRNRDTSIDSSRRVSTSSESSSSSGEKGKRIQ